MISSNLLKQKISYLVGPACWSSGPAKVMVYHTRAVCRLLEQCEIGKLSSWHLAVQPATRNQDSIFRSPANLQNLRMPPNSEASKSASMKLKLSTRSYIARCWAICAWLKQSNYCSRCSHGARATSLKKPKALRVDCAGASEIVSPFEENPKLSDPLTVWVWQTKTQGSDIAEVTHIGSVQRQKSLQLLRLKNCHKTQKKNSFQHGAATSPASSSSPIFLVPCSSGRYVPKSLTQNALDSSSSPKCFYKVRNLELKKQQSCVPRSQRFLCGP